MGSDWIQEKLEEREILLGMYRELERRFREAALPADYLRATAGVELFNTDVASLIPDMPYVLSALARAEEILFRHRK
ncbi:MAG: hypothetical protein J4469_02010 [Candidatus Aenigmarchaeota archaeon]|nr:hypothetical protein [Candidatus Aenigmarchaeota archaeon]